MTTALHACTFIFSAYFLICLSYLFIYLVHFAHELTHLENDVNVKHTKIKINFLKIFSLSINLMWICLCEYIMRSHCTASHRVVIRLVSVKLNLQFVINSKLAEKMQPFAINKKSRKRERDTERRRCVFENVTFVPLFSSTWNSIWVYFSSVPSVVISNFLYLPSFDRTFASTQLFSIHLVLFNLI